MPAVEPVMSNAHPILVAGVGNELLSDDGVGVHIIRELEKNPIQGVRAVEIGTAILDGLPYLEGAERVLLVDAARGGQPPGTVYLFDAASSAATGSATSLHGLGLIEAARVLLPGWPAPPVTVIGVEPERLDFGMELSGVVRAAVPSVVRLVRETVSSWMQARGTVIANASTAATARGNERVERPRLDRPYRSAREKSLVR